MTQEPVPESTPGPGSIRGPLPAVPPGPVPDPVPDPAPGPTPAATPELDRDETWQRLDPRMLLVHPVRELIRFLPAVIGVFVAGAAQGGTPWQLLGVVVPVALGVARYLTTAYRIHDARVELRRGLLSRHVLSTPIDRVRTVDLTSSLIHRALGLTTVVVGTGTASTRGSDRLDLDALPTARARELRADLLQAAPEAVEGPVADLGPDEAAASGPGRPHPGSASTAPVAPLAPEPPAVRFTPAWLRFAPFTSGGLLIAGAVLGLASQLGDELGLWRRVDDLASSAESAPSLLVLVPVLVVGLVVVVSLLAVVGYLVTNWDFTLTRTRSRGGGAWHVRRGLLTTRETTLDLERVAGVELGEQLGLRVAGGRRLDAIVTGLSGEQQSGALLPPAPRHVAEQAAVAVVGSAGPVTAPLVGHGPRAATRRWVRALVPAGVVAAGAVVAVVLGAPDQLLVLVLAVPAAAGLAADRVRGLGHALVDGHLVARSGSLVRKRAVLDVDHVIGWNLEATWFQRRVGLTTLVATTAGGSQRVVLLDVPEEVAVALAARATPSLLREVRR